MRDRTHDSILPQYFSHNDLLNQDEDDNAREPQNMDGQIYRRPKR